MLKYRYLLIRRTVCFCYAAPTLSTYREPMSSIFKSFSLIFNKVVRQIWKDVRRSLSSGAHPWNPSRARIDWDRPLFWQCLPSRPRQILVSLISFLTIFPFIRPGKVKLVFFFNWNIFRNCNWRKWMSKFGIQFMLWCLFWGFEWSVILFRALSISSLWPTFGFI